MALGQLAVAAWRAPAPRARADRAHPRRPAWAGGRQARRHGPPDELRGKAVLRVISGILAPPAFDPPPSSPEVEALTLELVKAIGNDGITQAIRSIAEESQKAGRKVAPGVETL